MGYQDIAPIEHVINLFPVDSTQYIGVIAPFFNGNIVGNRLREEEALGHAIRWQITDAIGDAVLDGLDIHLFAIDDDVPGLRGMKASSSDSS